MSLNITKLNQSFRKHIQPTILMEIKGIYSQQVLREPRKTKLLREHFSEMGVNTVEYFYLTILSN